MNINVQDKHLHVFARGSSLLHVFQVAVAETQTVCSCGSFESLEKPWRSRGLVDHEQLKKEAESFGDAKNSEGG